jgi:hypothetical protein
MWPAGIEPAARRVSNGRSTGLSYGHVGMGEAGFEPATSCVLDKHSGQAELLAHVRGQLRDKGSNLGLHVQSVVS